MSEIHEGRHYIFIALAALALVVLCWTLGLEGQALWTIPIVAFFFFLAFHWDVKLRPNISMSANQVIALPAVVLLQSPALTGLLSGIGVLASRTLRKGVKGLRPVNLFDGLSIAVSTTAGGWLLLHLTRDLPGDSLMWFPYLALAMALSSVVNLVGFALDRVAVGTEISLAFLGRVSLQTALWILLCLPFVGLVVSEIIKGNGLEVVLAGLPLVVIVWALHLNAGLEEKNLALVLASRRQEFLQQLTMTSAGSLENEGFLLDLLRGLRQFVPWDRELLLILPMPSMDEPMLFTLGELPQDPHGVKDSLVSLIADPTVKRPRLTTGPAVKPILGPGAESQLVLSLATSEIAFGILVIERTTDTPFREEEVKFLELAFGQIAQHVQDEILKKQLLLTNRKLLHQTDYLSQILYISNLLKVHLDVQGILERVAQGIRSGIGFHTVLISLYHEEHGFFERLAQAGVDDRWDEIRAVQPPAQDILVLLRDKYRVGNCFLIRHTEEVQSPYDILPVNPRVPQEPDDWDPMDMLIVPLYDKDERLLGIISVDEPSDGKVPSMETLRALEVLANQTVHALESAQVHQHIKRQAVIDGLTGLYNHGYFQESLALKARELSDVHKPYTVLMMDLDNFKEVNDTHGHLVGDDVLRAVSETLATCIRKEDVAARYGGEEFAVFLPDCTVEQSRPIAERIRSTVDQIRVPLGTSARPIRVTISLGGAGFPQNGRDHHEVLLHADTALYQAKRQGKNRVVLAGSSPAAVG